MDRFESVQEALPDGKEFKLRHLKTRSRNCRRLIYRPPADKKKQELDRITTHLITLSHDGLDVYALEAFNYESEEEGKRVHTLFVSKADTSGYGDKLFISGITTEIMRGLMRHYVNINGPDVVRVCLFAKAENQYLFPLSSDNPAKHILWDTALVKWWCKALEPLKPEFDNLSKARLQIPGSDDKSIKACFPNQSQLPWQVGDVFWADDGSHSDLKAVRCIPRFPDDPKSRFLEFLVAERRAKKTSREQFWLELQARQEFRLGSVVGIIGLEGTPGKAEPIELPHSMRSSKVKMIREILISSDFSKEDAAREAFEQMADHTPGANMLTLVGNNTLVRKPKPKPADTANVLNASFIRKKKK